MRSNGIEHYNSKITSYALACWILAAFGGFLFGYDIGISGGVISMDDFLIKFFPEIYERKMHVYEDNYCKYDNHKLQLFTSSLYLAALVASFFASKASTVLGRRPTITMASAFFSLGAILCGFANNVWMLIIGRLLFGIGVGFGNEAIPLFLIETAPIEHRGGVNILFQLFITIGILIANIINYVMSHFHPNSWRVSLGLEALPGAVLFVGSLIITETPASLVQMGRDEHGKEALKRVRGVDDVEAEFREILAAVERGRRVKRPFKRIFEKSGVPALVVSIMIQLFQQLTGINAIMFYAPVLFEMLGFRSDASLLSSVITGLINVGSTFVSIFIVDKVGRRKLLLQACVQMFISMVAIGGILLVYLKSTGSLHKGVDALVVVLVCTFVMSFAWSWGPMGWLIPIEIYPIETRSAGFAMAVSSNMIFTFIIAQAFLSMLCLMKAYIFFFFAAWIVVMGLFVLFLLPETKGIPMVQIEDRVWKKHPFWKRFFKDEQKADQIA
ncbi:hypothetical protein CASFOL_005348 [Castilleja foliolosa]|uniref:Major facilitator superfamily (MFS) profile domain-containing protein n=1 Tax=Castilleja foliolosa TaxID=1961234 RepID=A0ABD3E363_9LAMI